MSSKNGSKKNGILLQSDVRGNALKKLGQAVENGSLHLKAAPDIQDIIIPELPEPVVPTVTVQVGGLKALAERILAKKAADKAALNQKQQAYKEAKGRQREQVQKIIDRQKSILPHLYDIETVCEQLDEDGNLISEDLLVESALELWGIDKTFGQLLAEWRSDINRWHNDKRLAISLPLIASEAAFRLSVKPFKNGIELLEELQKLEKSSVLQKRENGQIFFQDPATRKQDRFSLNARFDVVELEDEDRHILTQNIKRAVEDQVQRLKKELEDADREQARKLWEDPKQPAIFLWNDREDGIFNMITPEGGVVITCNGDVIEAMGAFGRQENGFRALVAVERATGLKVAINRKTLKNNQGQLRNELYDVHVAIPKEIARNTPAYIEWMKAGKFLWHECRDALAQVLACENQQMLGAEEFHQERILGPYQVKMKFLVNNQGDFHDLDMVVERFMGKDAKRRLRVASVQNPEHVTLLERMGCLSPEKEMGCCLDPDGFPEGVETGPLVFVTKVLRKDYKAYRATN